MFGSPFGLVGAGAGAIIGFIYGNLAKRDEEKKADEEAQRQAAADAELERQIADHKAKESARAEGGKAAPGRKQGVTIVKDHLADAPAPPTGSASAPSGGGARDGTPGSPGVARATPPETDAEGFRPVYEGGRLVRRERDAQSDGRPDTILHYAADGQLERREDSSRLDGRMDMWTYYVKGTVVRKEADTRGTGEVDLWVHYDESGNVVRADLLVEKDVKLTQLFADRQVAREEWRRHPGGQLTAVAIHKDGKIVQREEDSTGQGRLDLVSVFDPAGQLVKQGRRAEEGRLTSWRYFDPGGRVVREEELGKDGEVVAVSFFEDGRLTRKELYVLDEDVFRRAPRVPDAPVATQG
jgi:hypothetical protein